MLVNKEDSHGNYISSEIRKLVKKINNQNLKVNILFTGSIFLKNGLMKNNKISNSLGYVFHPSGYVLNRYSSKYKNIWYDFNQNEVKNTSKAKTVKLNKFMIFK